MPDAPFDVKKAHRWFAIECNNKAWDFIEAKSRSEAEVNQLIHMAHTALFHWKEIGTDLNQLRAMTLLAMAYVVAESFERAREYTSQGLDLLANKIDGTTDFDTACMHGVATMAYADVDTQTAQQHAAHAKKVVNQFEEADETALFQKLFPAIEL